MKRTALQVVASGVRMTFTSEISMTRGEADGELMTRVRDGSLDSLGVLFERHHRALLNFFCRLGDERALGEDLVQEVFYRILKYRRSYKPGSAFRTWLYEIARNARADAFHNRHVEVGLERDAMPTIVPRDETQRSQDVSLLERALGELSHDKREILVLSRYQELKYQDIADILNCEVGTVKVRVHRALRDLKEKYRILAKEPAGRDARRTRG